MDPNSKEFLKLQKKWYKKLERKGFEDIEQEDGNLKFWASHFFKSRYNATVFNAKEDYFRMAGQFLHSYKFESNKEKAMWELHCQGHSVRTIVQVMKALHYKTYKFQVHTTIQRLFKLMMTESKNE